MSERSHLPVVRTIFPEGFNVARERIVTARRRALQQLADVNAELAEATAAAEAARRRGAELEREVRELTEALRVLGADADQLAATELR